MWIVFLAVVGALEFLFLLPTATVYSNRIWIPPWYSNWFVITVTWALMFPLVRLAMDPIRIYFSQFRYALRYPPLWISILGALLLASAADRLPPRMQPLHASLRWWQDGVGFLTMAVMTAAVIASSA